MLVSLFLLPITYTQHRFTLFVGNVSLLYKTGKVNRRVPGPAGLARRDLLSSCQHRDRSVMCPAVVQDDEEVEMMRQEQMEEGDAQHEAGDNGEDDEEE